MLEKNSLKNRKISLHGIPNPWIAFFVTAIALVVFFAVSDAAPFGRNVFLLSDLRAQYAPKLVAYKDHFFAEGILSYSFQNGMGKNVMGVFGYYLSSPFNLVTFLFPSKWIAQAVVIMIVLKLSLAGAFMSLFLETRSGKKDKSSILFALLYVFSTYIVIYMMNIMWLDGFLLLPLLLVVTEKYMKDRSRWVYLVICLTILFISGYYIAYMVGIFSFLYLLGRCVERKAFASESIKNTRKTILLFIGSAILASGLSIWVLLPAGLDTLGNPDYTSMPFSHTTLFDPLRIFDQFFIGAFDSLMYNKPLLYAGMITNILVVLFFLHPNISKRRKIVTGVTLLFFFLSFIYTGLARFWHLFDDPNWFLHRQSFLAVFVLVAIAYNTFIKRYELKRKQFIICGLIISAALIFVASFGDMREEGERFFINIFFLAVILVLLWGSTLTSWPEALARLKKVAMPFLVVIIVVEIVFINSLWVRTEAEMRLGRSTEQFSREYQHMQMLRNYAEEYRNNDANNFYRMEVDHRTTIMCNWTGGHYLNYPSISVFQSVANKQTNRFLKQLGMRTNYNYFSSIHSYNSIPADSFLGIEYVMTNIDQSAGYPLIQSRGNDDGAYYLFHNNRAFPLIFPVQSKADEFDFYRLERNEINKDYFAFQNDWWTSLFSQFEDIEIFYPAHIEGPSLNNAIISESMFIGEKMHIQRQDSLGLEPREGSRDIETQYLRINPNANMVFEYEIHVESTDPLYFCLPMWDNDLRGVIFLNDELFLGPAMGYFTEIIELGTFEPGDILKLRFESSEEIDGIGIIDAYAYHIDVELFNVQMEQTDVYTAVRHIDVKNGHVRATLQLEKEALVLTTIPYEKGWTLYVNGEEFEIIPYQDAFISFPLDEGDHEIELVFRAPGLRTGIIISIASVLIFIALATFTFMHRGKNDRQTKENP